MRRDLSKRRRGVVLIIVLVVVTVLALAAYTFSDLMVSHRRVATVNGQRLQARLLVYSGMEVVKQYLMQDEASREQSGGHFNNPAAFQGIPVIPDLEPEFRGSFTVLAPYLDDAGLSMGGVRYGLEDESSRLNLNLLLIADGIVPGSGRALLMALPGMTEDVADAILDWIDEDEETRDYGAEFIDYYATLSPSYKPRNGPLQSVEELLLVRGVTPALLFGADFNRNGMIDQHEQSTSASLGMGGATALAPTMASSNSATLGANGLPQLGWASYLTLYSSERNTTPDGLPRIYLNGDDLETLKDDLSTVFSEEQTNFILAYRLYGPDSQQASIAGTDGVSASEVDLDLTQTPQAQIGQVLDLIGATVRTQVQSESTDSGTSSSGSSSSGGGRSSTSSSSGGNANIVVKSPFADDVLSMSTYLSTLMNNCTVVDAEAIPGRININEAQREILLGIPAVSAATGENIMTEAIVDEIVSLRTATDTSDHSHETWLLSEAVVSLDEMKALSPFICAGGDVYRCQIVGYFQGGGPSARAEVVFDATGDSPRVLFWRDISHLGRGHALETLGVDIVQGVNTP